jgi:4-hydroxy-tetrahydrodipicolinate reductase
MGKSILRLAELDGDIEIAGAVEFEGSPFIGQGVPKIASDKNLDALLNQADVLIDFTNPQSAMNNLRKVHKAKKAVVIGTTGFNQEQKDEICVISKDIALILSPNMSVGVNLLFSLVEQAARVLSDYDIEIFEMHHNKKKDAPSGTAIRLAEIAAQNAGLELEKSAVYERHSVNRARQRGEIGIMSARGGDVVGDHTVYFAGPGETIELIHRAGSRDTFASGALKAAKWLKGRQVGLYSMKDVLIQKQ